ncbi:MAG: imidazoleglycerol-phosphate dehydratase HisB [Pseudomonadota bacterium]
MARQGTIQRKTKETSVSLTIDLDGSGHADVSTGIPFLDHMLTLIASHGFIDLRVRAEGDLAVDAHHTVEDIGICLGMGLLEALGEKCGICRYGSAIAPMDEALAEVALDISGRGYLVYQVPAAGSSGKIGNFDVELVREFFQALASRAAVTLHVNCRYGRNSHHIVEAIFKAFGRALDAATAKESRSKGVLSSKGVL